MPAGSRTTDAKATAVTAAPVRTVGVPGVDGVDGLPSVCPPGVSGWSGFSSWSGPGVGGVTELTNLIGPSVTTVSSLSPSLSLGTVMVGGPPRCRGSPNEASTATKYAYRRMRSHQQKPLDDEFTGPPASYVCVNRVRAA